MQQRATDTNKQATDRQTDRQADRQTDRQTDRQGGVRAEQGAGGRLSKNPRTKSTNKPLKKIIPVQNPTINPLKNKSPYKIHRKTILQNNSVKKLRQKNVPEMYLKVEIWIV